MNVVKQIQGWRDDEREQARACAQSGNRNGANIHKAWAEAYGEVLALLDGAVEVQGWIDALPIPSTPQGESVHIYPVYGRDARVGKPRLPVTVLIIAGEACPHCAKPLVKEVRSSPDGLGGDIGTNCYVCKECRKAV